ncbi:MAG: hypothetical protein U9N87_05705, partial [Planctomycetota bacterium]|nr:hypothetical protein [Planctomycetota bacterium]
MTSSKPGGKTADAKPQSVWHKSAPQSVRVLDRKLDGKLPRDVETYQNAQKAWAKHLRKRKNPLPLAKLLPGKTHPLSWALPHDFAARASVAEASDAAKFNPDDEEQIRQWLDCGAGEEEGAGLAHALEALAWCHALPRLGESEAWWDLLQRLVSTTVDASALTPVEDGILSQLAGGELALTLAYLFPEINVCRKLARQARAVLSVGLVDLLDGQGMPQAQELPMLRPLLASWTRCRAMGATMKKGCFNSAAEDQYQWLIRQSLRMSRPDGSRVFSQSCDAARGDAAKAETVDLETRRCRDLFTAALLFGDDDDRDIAAAALPKWFKKPGMLELPEAAYHSEWSSTSVLRPDWSAGGARLTALFDGRSGVDIELSSGKNVVFSGPWQWQVSLGGKTLEALSDWEEICWVSDEDADYVELEMALTEDVVLQRHILMARDDGFLLLADSVLCDEETAKKPKIEYRATLPLAAEMNFQPAEETHEAMLASSKKNLAQILPLAFPEWRESDSPGSLKQTSDGLELKFS